MMMEVDLFFSCVLMLKCVPLTRMDRYRRCPFLNTFFLIWGIFDFLNLKTSRQRVNASTGRKCVYEEVGVGDRSSDDGGVYHFVITSYSYYYCDHCNLPFSHSGPQLPEHLCKNQAIYSI